MTTTLKHDPFNNCHVLIENDNGKAQNNNNHHHHLKMIVMKKKKKTKLDDDDQFDHKISQEKIIEKREQMTFVSKSFPMEKFKKVDLHPKNNDDQFCGNIDSDTDINNELKNETFIEAIEEVVTSPQCTPIASTSRQTSVSSFLSKQQPLSSSMSLLVHPSTLNSVHFSVSSVSQLNPIISMPIITSSQQRRYVANQETDDDDDDDTIDNYDTLPPPYRYDDESITLATAAAAVFTEQHAPLISNNRQPTSSMGRGSITSRSTVELNQIGHYAQYLHYHGSPIKKCSAIAVPPSDSNNFDSDNLPTPYDKLIQFKKRQQKQLLGQSSSSNSLRRSSLPLASSTINHSLNENLKNLLIMNNNAQQANINKEKRIGHRRVNEEGQVTYKKIKSTQIMYSIQLGIGYSVGSLASKPERDLLMQDFMQIETVNFPKSGSQITPAHHYTDFVFSTYTPFAFRYFRDLFRIQPDDFMLSITNESLNELSNPGASGSMFFRTKNDQFIIKTVEKNEAKFLLTLLPGYYMNISQNPQTILPKFFGLYCYECIGKNIRILVMNNILPSSIPIHQKYDLKGSTYKRRASPKELKKFSPTFKDLDFLEHYYNDENILALTKQFTKLFNVMIDSKQPTFPTDGGLLLEAHVYDKLVEILHRDCRVLQSFEIMDYSLLIGVHNYDQALREKQPDQQLFDIDNEDELPDGAIRAINRKGERLLLFIGIIDILQSYRLAKKMEHAWKSILHDGNSISVTRPDFYAKRFLDFMNRKVFGRLPGPSTEFNYYHYKNRSLNRNERNHHLVRGNGNAMFSWR